MGQGVNKRCCGKKGLCCGLLVTSGVLVASGIGTVAYLATRDDSESSNQADGNSSGGRIGPRDQVDEDEDEDGHKQRSSEFLGISYLASFDPNSVVVEWDPVNDHSVDSQKINYSISYSDLVLDDQTGMMLSANSTGGTRIEIKGLQENTLYHFQIFAYLPSGLRLDPQDTLVNSTRTIRVAKKLSDKYDSRYLSDMGFFYAELNPVAQTLVLKYASEAKEFPRYGQVLIGTSNDGDSIVVTVDSVEEIEDDSLLVAFSVAPLAEVYENLHLLGQSYRGSYKESTTSVNARRRRVLQIGDGQFAANEAAAFNVEIAETFGPTTVSGLVTGKIVSSYELLILNGSISIFEVASSGSVRLKLAVNFDLEGGVAKDGEKTGDLLNLRSKASKKSTKHEKAININPFVKVSVYSKAFFSGSATVGITSDSQISFKSAYRYTPDQGVVQIAKQANMDSSAEPKLDGFELDLGATVGSSLEVGFFLGPFSVFSSKVSPQFDSRLSAAPSDPGLLNSGLVPPFTINKVEIKSGFQLQVISDLTALYDGGGSEQLESLTLLPVVLYTLPQIALDSICSPSSTEDEGVMEFSFAAQHGVNSEVDTSQANWLAWNVVQPQGGQSLLVKVTKEELEAQQKTAPLKVFVVLSTSGASNIRLVGGAQRSESQLCLEGSDDDDDDNGDSSITGLAEQCDPNKLFKGRVSGVLRCCPTVEMYLGSSTYRSTTYSNRNGSSCAQIGCIEGCEANQHELVDITKRPDCAVLCGCHRGEDGYPVEAWCTSTFYTHPTSDPECGWELDCSGQDEGASN